MVDADPVRRRRCRQAVSASNLALRIVSALVLAPLALLAAYLGGWPFALFWAVAALAVLWEWITLVAGAALSADVLLVRRRHRDGRFCRVARTVRSTAIAAWLVSARLPPRFSRRASAGSGSTPASAMPARCLLAPMFLRGDDAYGFAVIVLLFAVVWTTDILGYFAGPRVRRPEACCRAVSPKKTWSGAIVGTLRRHDRSAGRREPVRLVRQARHRRRRAGFVGRGAVSAICLNSCDQAAVRRQGFQPSHSRPWRRDGSARRLLGGCACRLRHRRCCAAASMAPRADCWYGERMTVVTSSRTKSAAGRRGAARITILGATGSIGASTIDLIKREPRPLSRRGRQRAAQRRRARQASRASSARAIAVGRRSGRLSRAQGCALRLAASKRPPAKTR